MIVLHGLQTCDACRAARRALEDAGREVRMRDLRADPPGAAEVGAWVAALGDGVLNRRSTTWRTLPEAARADDPLALMVAHPTLVKRPVIERAGAPPLLGWTAATRVALGL